MVVGFDGWWVVGWVANRRDRSMEWKELGDRGDGILALPAAAARAGAVVVVVFVA